MIYYKDEEIEIRDICKEDVIGLFTTWIDKEINSNDPRPIPKTSKELIAECIDYCNRFDTEIMNENTENRKYKYFIITNNLGNLIGFVNLFSIDNEKKQGEMGVSMCDKRFLNKGIAYTAIMVAINYIFENMNIDRIYIETAESNLPALKLCEKLKFNKCGEYIEDNVKAIIMEKLRN
ncbi:MAG: N-acetyltransferase [Clostridiales bacterium]|jgi:RimJ/RimL family protein N-acetyltransferase|nr:N-acetyltransferase [Clostridiales bacterium]